MKALLFSTFILLFANTLYSAPDKKGAYYQLEDAAKEPDFAIQGEYSGSYICLLYTSPSPRDRTRSRMPSSA